MQNDSLKIPGYSYEGEEHQPEPLSPEKFAELFVPDIVIDRLIEAGHDPVDRTEFGRAWSRLQALDGAAVAARKGKPTISAILINPTHEAGDPMADRGYLGLRFEPSALLIEFTGDRDADALVEQAIASVTEGIRAAVAAVQPT